MRIIKGIKNLFKILGLVIILFACEDDIYDREAFLFNINVSVIYPSHYNVTNADSVIIRLINLENGLSCTAITDENGNVSFMDVKKGKYRLSAGKKLNAGDAIELGETIVDEQDVEDGRLVNLNGTMEDIFLSDFANLGTIQLRSSLPGSYLIKEVFYTGTTTPNNRAYYSDHFVEIFNNTDKILYADSICIADVYGANGSVDSSPTQFASDLDNVYLKFVWMIPGDGHDYPIQPGESIIIAQDGINHRDDPNGNPNSIDLSMANWETFLKRDVQRDIDVIEVSNMIEIFASRPNTHDWLLHSYGSSIVIFKTEDPFSLESVPVPYSTQGYMLMKLPVNNVLDAFEALAHANSGIYKRIPKDLDVGFVYCNGIYNGESCRRKVEDVVDGRIILQDTNNSGEDFDVISFPTPKQFE